MSITTSNLYSASYSAIETFIKGISGIDPKRRDRKNFIHASQPNINGKDFEGYPFIILKIDLMEDHPSFDGQISDKTFKAQITIYCEDATDLDGMSDKIVSNYKSETQLTDFQIKQLNSSPINYLMDLKGKKILYRNIWLIFKKRI